MSDYEADDNSGEEYAAQWQEFFDDLINEANGVFNNCELINKETGLAFCSTEKRGSEEEIDFCYNLVMNSNKEGPPSVMYMGKKFIFLRKIEEGDDKTPSFLFMRAETNEENAIEGCVCKCAFDEFLFIATFNKSKMSEALRIVAKALE
ncbi:hypothetical protein TCON_1451 [Astathelohania contejeani]|uniref:Profilin n=1 Tax=Astathelohania contejeani TaxID=164912 RepID=A0ABQ7HZ12_9MICR|nr:hypothetical protein TCON_1451 [Thelohania contejeani]